MIQIIGLRPKVGTQLADKDFEDYSIFDKYKIEAESIQDILLNPDEYLKLLPKAEHWNIFFTTSQCGIKKRSFEALEVLPFDFDGIDTNQTEAYIEVFCKCLGVKREETGIVFSGNGLHFYIGLEVKIVDKKFFSQSRHHYKAILEKITAALKARDLPIGKVDPSVFDAARILRMPNTKNIKVDRADTECRVIQPVIKNILFDIAMLSGLPTVKANEAIPKEYLRKYPKTDNEAILKGCNFLKFCKSQPDEISEPQWYAMLSITARMEQGSQLSHEISKGHKSYTHAQTEAKIEHALNASPPRKCTSINALWGGCRSCPNFEKVESPIMIRDADKIPTETTGFHTVTVTDKGMGKPIPCYSDLRKFFERNHYYVAHSKMCYVWNNTHYEIMENARLENFAQQNFNPYAHTGMTSEFKNLVLRTNVVRPREWIDSTKRKINFQNGILDVDTMDFLPHNKELGFKYALPYDYDPKATAPRFEKFLSEIMCGDKDMAEILLEFGGYSLSGDDCKGAKALFLLGEGSNGKSTYIKVLKALAGRDNYQTISLKDLSNMERRHALDGALFNIAEETPDRVADSNDFKNLVDGGEIKVRKLFSDDYTIENRAKLIFTCNTLPATYDTTMGYRRRLIIIPFEATFSADTGTEDKDLDQKLFGELAGIFNIMLAAYKRFVARGKKFTKSEKAEKTLIDYDNDNDPIKDFLNNCATYSQPSAADFYTTRVTIGELYQSYVRYCEANRRHIMANVWFARRLKYTVPNYLERYNRSTTNRGFFGIILEDDGPSY
jgi:putative DNA primase/helicase